MPQDPAAIAQNWAARLGQSTEKIKAGVAGVTLAPGQAAARQKAVWLANTTNSADKWARNTAAVTLPEWQAAMNDKGVGRIASGANAAVDKFTTFMSALLPHIEAGKRALPARGDLEANITRMVAYTRHMAKFQRPA